MINFAQTSRFILREITPSDESAMFELDSDESVHRFVGNRPLKNIQQTRQIICRIRQQYFQNGIGRWAIVDKQTNAFVGWAGLRLIKFEINNHVNYFDLSFRLLKKYWRKGIATEAAMASVEYGFDKVEVPAIYSMVDCDNWASHHVLNKLGFSLLEQFTYENKPYNWFRIQKKQWDEVKKGS